MNSQPPTTNKPHPRPTGTGFFALMGFMGLLGIGGMVLIHLVLAGILTGFSIVSLMHAALKVGGCLWLGLLPLFLALGIDSFYSETASPVWRTLKQGFAILSGSGLGWVFADLVGKNSEGGGLGRWVWQSYDHQPSFWILAVICMVSGGVLGLALSCFSALGAADKKESANKSHEDD